MHHFAYRHGILHAEDVALPVIADAVGTPFYCYSAATITRHFTLFADALGARDPKARRKIFYALKANSNQAVLRLLGKLGAGADTVSEGEIRRALASGIPPDSIVFSGVGKSAEELAFAVDAGIYQINIETESELNLLSEIATARGKRQAAVIRINPDVGAGGHAKITTGSDANKFGVSLREAERIYARAANMSGVSMVGLAVHIGSQIRELSELEQAFTRMAATTRRLRAEGHGVERIDCGGGLGIDYHQAPGQQDGPDLIHAYARLIDSTFGREDLELGFEPGRLIVGNAGILVTKAIHHNPRPHTTFLVVDAAMNDLIRPAMYEAYHEVWPIKETAAGSTLTPHDVVGPICETGDTFTSGRPLAPVNQGDLIAFMTAGAYGAVMSSTYNSRRLVPEVMVSDDRFAVVRPRPTFDDLIGLDRVPDWLA